MPAAAVELAQRFFGGHSALLHKTTRTPASGTHTCAASAFSSRASSSCVARPRCLSLGSLSLGLACWSREVPRLHCGILSKLTLARPAACTNFCLEHSCRRVVVPFTPNSSWHKRQMAVTCLLGRRLLRPVAWPANACSFHYHQKVLRRPAPAEMVLPEAGSDTVSWPASQWQRGKAQAVEDRVAGVSQARCPVPPPWGFLSTTLSPTPLAMSTAACCGCLLFGSVGSACQNKTWKGKASALPPMP